MTISKPLVDASVNVGTSQVTLLEAVAKRDFLVIANAHATQALWVNYTGGTAAANGLGCVQIPALSNMRFDGFVPSNKITAIASGATTPVTVLHKSA